MKFVEYNNSNLKMQTENNNELEKYSRIEKLGEGTYGIVYKCKNKDNQELVAVKK